MRTSSPGLLVGPRERDPGAEIRFRAAAQMLQARGDGRGAGWLLLALVDVELRRKGSLAPAAEAIAHEAADALASAGELRAAAATLQATGDAVAAAALLERAGAVAAAARARASAGRVPLGSVPVQPGVVATESESAAVYRAAAEAIATLPVDASGQPALELCTILELYAPAARLAARAKDHRRAAQLWTSAGEPLSAALEYARADMHDAAFEAVTRVRHDHPAYRQACVFAIRLAVRLDRVVFAIDHLVAPFLSTPPQSEPEADAHRRLAGLYARHGQLEFAERILASFVESFPQDQRAAAELAHLRRARGAGRGTAPGARVAEPPGLPPAPDLSLPLAPSARVDAGPVAPDRTVRVSRLEGSPASSSKSASKTPPLEGALRMVGSLPGPGAVVGGRYRIDAQLGVGGAAVVYRVWDTELDEPVALKVLNAPVSDAKQVERFRQELRLARRLAHRNVVRLHDIGVHEGFRYLTMELLSGRDMRRWLDKGVTRGLALGWLLQAAEGLDAAHREGVVHRDVKPENLLVGEDGVVKVMDFGIARAIDLRSVTAHGVFAGTPSYIAPEQITSFSGVGPSADLYSLAVVAYEVICGRVPFDHPTLPGLLLAHTQQPPPSPRQFVEEVPAAMEREFFRALAKNPKQRHPDCATMIRSLLAESPWQPPSAAPVTR